MLQGVEERAIDIFSGVRYNTFGVCQKVTKCRDERALESATRGSRQGPRRAGGTSIVSLQERGEQGGHATEQQQQQ